MSTEQPSFKHVIKPDQLIAESLFPVDVRTLEGARIFLKDVVARTQNIGSPQTVEAMQTVIADLMEDPGENGEAKDEGWNVITLKKRIPGSKHVLEVDVHYSDDENSESPTYINTEFFESSWDGYQTPIYWATYTLVPSVVDRSSVVDSRDVGIGKTIFVDSTDLQDDPNFNGYNAKLEEGARWTIANLLTFKEPGWVEPGQKNTETTPFRRSTL